MAHGKGYTNPPTTLIDINSLLVLPSKIDIGLSELVIRISVGKSKKKVNHFVCFTMIDQEASLQLTSLSKTRIK